MAILLLTSCSSTKQIEVPVTKIDYRDKVRVFEKVPLCHISKAESLSVENIAELALTLTADLEKCNNQIQVYNSDNESNK